jgi:hypothetical protein
VATRTRKSKQPHTVTREEFRRDPSGTFKQAATLGRIVIIDAQGHAVAVLSSPTERIAVARD